MRKPLFFLLPLLVSCLLPASGWALVPEIELSVPMVVSGTPLEMEVNLHRVRPDATLRADVMLDGRKVDTVELQAGKHTLVLSHIQPAAGSHQLTLEAAQLSASSEFSLLPGWLSLVPPLLAIALALIFRDVLVSLFLGVFSGALILAGFNPFAAFGRSIDAYLVPALADSDRISIIVFTSLLGAMVGLITKSGGTHGIIEMLTPYATSGRRGQVATALMGLLIFFDDYANTLIVGPTMRPITDRLKISREKLAYIVDSTAAPVVCLFPISTWVGFEIGLIGEAFKSLGIGVDPYTTFVASIPYRFYPIFALVLVFTLALSRLDFGPMRKAELRARNLGQVLAPDARPIADYSTEEVEPAAGAPKRALNALLPIFTVIIMTVVGIYRTGVNGLQAAAVDTSGMSTGDWIRALLEQANSYHALLWASLAGTLMALGLILGQRILKLDEAIRALVGGIKAMFLALLVLTLAWSLSDVCGGLDTAQYLVGLTQQTLTPGVLPVITFVLAAAVAFATGSSWGTMGILEPLVIPIAHKLSLVAGYEVWDGSYQSVMLATIAAVLTGSVWGDHCSPISDTTILSSTATGCDHIAHVRTQLPYALSTGILAIAAALMTTAVGVSAWIMVATGVALIIAAVLVLGRRQGAGGPDGDTTDGAVEATE